MDEIMTAEQVAKVLQVHPFTVLKFIKNGKLKASKLGRVYRIRRSDVEKLLDSNIEQPKGESKKEKTPKPQPQQKEAPRKKEAKPAHGGEQHTSSGEGKNHQVSHHYVLKIKE